MLYRFIGLAVSEVNNAYANSRGLEMGELDSKTNPFAGTHEHVEDANVKRIGLRHILVKLDESVPFAVKELTAYDANGKEVGHVDYAVQYDDHLSLDFVILRKDSFEKAVESCQEVAKIDKGSVYGMDGKINRLL
ncbi:unnamed protein product [Heligmosomoides polygyrus]|uniref:PRC domain-containing protein n=1 Tax=Heligmosomoides polygyrus TaxID=6339 RepID=A0A183F826_HELPZ|nr:unnamed protein product [Heligmosomoides polygyrus]